MIRLIVNGDSRVVERSGTVEELIAELQLPKAAVLVEHNGMALLRSDWSATRLAENDRVEILRVAAGG
jgi:thiamine biosynthesis protein ThiS